MLDDKQVIYLKLLDEKILVRNVNHKIMASICELVDIPLLRDDELKRDYIPIEYLNSLVKIITASNRHVFII